MTASAAAAVSAAAARAGMPPVPLAFGVAVDTQGLRGYCGIPALGMQCDILAAEDSNGPGGAVQSSALKDPLQGDSWQGSGRSM